MRSGDLYALYQMVRAYIPELIVTHTDALAWFEIMLSDHPCVDVFAIDKNDRKPRVDSQAMRPSPTEMLGPAEPAELVKPDQRSQQVQQRSRQVQQQQ